MAALDYCAKSIYAPFIAFLCKLILLAALVSSLPVLLFLFVNPPLSALTWPKQRILEVYLNERQASLLAAILPNPHQFNATRPNSYLY